MANHASFKVDPRITKLLGEGYRNVEAALKELVDNAWDAEAENVWITLPEMFSGDPIVVADDGSGMTPTEVRQDYLKIANDRLSRKGDRTPRLKRLVKGRKGIGKFAGFITAETLTLSTRARGKCTSVTLKRKELLAARVDLEQFKFPLEVVECQRDQHGTTIHLSDLDQRLSLPRPEVMRRALALEYRREPGFHIWVNGEALGFEDIPGESFELAETLTQAGPVRLRFTILDSPVPYNQAGIVTRVNGKVVGTPSLLGLDESSDIPSRLLRRIVGEIEADSLEEDVTADWGAILENSNAYQEARAWMECNLLGTANSRLDAEVAEEKHRQTELRHSRLERLPLHRRQLAERQIERVLKRHYGESPERIDTMVALVIDAFEKDDYWLVCEKLASTTDGDVSTLAAALRDFGLVQLALMSSAAQSKLTALDAFDRLINDPSTLECQVHEAIEKNLWMLGPEYETYSSNTTLTTIVQNYYKAKWKGKKSSNRPDLLLMIDHGERLLLIEFKRPNLAIGRQAERQAKEYRDFLTNSLNKRFEVIVMGGHLDPGVSQMYSEPDIQFLCYPVFSARSRKRFEWALEHLRI